MGRGREGGRERRAVGIGESEERTGGQVEVRPSGSVRKSVKCRYVEGQVEVRPSGSLRRHIKCRYVEINLVVHMVFQLLPGNGFEVC